MCLSATMALFGSAVIGEMARNDPAMPVIFRIFPFLAILRMGFAALGLVAGVNFLKLKAWARNVLEGLTSLLLICVIGFVVYWLHTWLSIATAHAPGGLEIMGAVTGIVIAAVNVVPLGIMLKYLRGPKIRHAVSGTPEQPHTEGTPATSPSAASRASDEQC